MTLKLMVIIIITYAFINVYMDNLVITQQTCVYSSVPAPQIIMEILLMVDAFYFVAKVLMLKIVQEGA